MREEWGGDRLSEIIVGKKIYEFKEVSSTMDVVKSKFATDSGVVVVSEKQSKGIGRFNRAWYSQGGKDLLFSYVLTLPINNIHTMIYKNSLSLFKTVSKLVDAHFLIKWPNDIYCDNYKIGGILTKTEILSKTAQVIVGVGLNVNSDQGFFMDRKLKATSLKCLTGKNYQKREILYHFLNELNLMLSNRFKENEIFSQWKNSLNIIDQYLHFSFMNNSNVVFKAIVKDVDETGRLVVIDSLGKKRILSSEDITILDGR